MIKDEVDPATNPFNLSKHLPSGSIQSQRYNPTHGRMARRHLRIQEITIVLDLATNLPRTAANIDQIAPVLFALIANAERADDSKYMATVVDMIVHADYKRRGIG
jgi:hypothetical protein